MSSFKGIYCEASRKRAKTAREKKRKAGRKKGKRRLKASMAKD